MDENILNELNSLKRTDLLKILTGKDRENIKISRELRNYFDELFSRKNRSVESCSKCSELSKLLKTIENDLRECKEIIKEFQSKLTKEYSDNEMGIKTSSSETYTLSQLESELKQFYNFCKDNKLSDDDISNICKPLLPPIKNLHSKSFRYFLIFLLITTLLYLLNYFETVQWHYTAVGRIFLIELLPLWNWKQMKNEKCLIKPLSVEAEPPGIQDCSFCEYIHKIDVVDAVQSDIIYEKYIKLFKPAILENGLEYWMETVNLEGVLDNILDDDILSQSIPCKFKSNIYYGSGNLYESLKSVQDNDVYFVHFQNCEFDAVKAFRKYFKRPKFLAPEILPVQYSWILISNNYKVDKYKQISLSDQATIVGQFFGKTNILLHPNKCPEDCESLKIELAAGEVLIFSGLWNMEYKPDPEGQNFAVVLETH